MLSYYLSRTVLKPWWRLTSTLFGAFHISTFLASVSFTKMDQSEPATGLSMEAPPDNPTLSRLTSPSDTAEDLEASAAAALLEPSAGASPEDARQIAKERAADVLSNWRLLGDILYV